MSGKITELNHYNLQFSFYDQQPCSCEKPLWKNRNFLNLKPLSGEFDGKCYSKHFVRYTNIEQLNAINFSKSSLFTRFNFYRLFSSNINSSFVSKNPLKSSYKVGLKWLTRPLLSTELRSFPVIPFSKISLKQSLRRSSLQFLDARKSFVTVSTWSRLILKALRRADSNELLQKT